MLVGKTEGYSRAGDFLEESGEQGRRCDLEGE